jgi:ZIP family zinc transporter
MLFLKALTEKGKSESKPEAKEKPTGLALAVAIDVAVDGLLVGLGFAAGAREGILLTIALGIEIFFLGLATSTALKNAGVRFNRMLLIHVGFALLIGTTGTLGATVLGGLTGAGLELLLSFGLAALLYLITEELLVEAHREGETPLATGTFFAGFLLFLIIGVLS